MSHHNHTPAEPTRRPLSRRGLIKAVGATAVGASISTMASGRASAAGATAADAIVIGAGYAGGTVARELAARGLKPVVLEARDRVGGRIFTATFGGEQVELGGAWLGPQQELVHAELKRYGIGTYLDTVAEQVVLPGPSGLRTMSPEQAATVVEPLWNSFYEGSQKYFERPHDPLYRKDLLASVDPLSLQDRLGKLSLAPEELATLSGETSVYSGGKSTFGSLTGMAQWIQLSGGSYGTYTTTMTLRPVGGMGALLTAMLNESKADVRLSTPVTKITEAKGVVTVETSNGQTFTSPVVVVATPTNTWRSIAFSPGLPTAHAQAASQGIGVPLATKVWMQLRGQVPAVQGQAAEGSALPMLIPQQQTSKGRIMVGFAGPSLDVSNRTKVLEAVRAYIPGAELLDYRVMEWGKAPYINGGWGLRKPNQLLTLFPAIEQPHGRILFAGADIARGWHGAFIEGAIESGLRAAEQAADLI
ncbi:flavin monoamine oxidase family protein [Streptomyces asiaticus]|uniref:flavin monoamine oxidase family protein n=1 Tax=Streptomyces asiaticus TaxID=114695 RepID=UPI003D72675F